MPLCGRRPSSHYLILCSGAPRGRGFNLSGCAAQVAKCISLSAAQSPSKRLCRGKGKLLATEIIKQKWEKGLLWPFTL